MDNLNNASMDSSLGGEGAVYSPRRRQSTTVTWDSNRTSLKGAVASADASDSEDSGSDDNSSVGQFQFAAGGNANTEDLSAAASPHVTKVNHHVSGALQTLMHDIPSPQGDALTPEQRTQAFRTISQVPPFSYLPNHDLESLLDDLHLVKYQDGQVIVQQGDSEDQSVYVVETGRVTMVQLKDKARLGEPSVRFLGYLDAPAYFGAYSTLFDCDRGSQIVAGGEVVAYRMSGATFESCLAHPAFRIKLALGLRSNGIFDDIERFVAIVRRAVAHEKQMDLGAILASYRHMTPAIHANLHSDRLDLEGWTYAIRRLPDKVTSTYVYLLAETVPLPFMHHDFSLKDIYVSTVARRRQAFAVDKGKLLVILRDNFSDALDFLSLLCAHIHESTKLRSRLTNPGSLDILHRCLWPSERRVADAASVPKGTATITRQRATYTKAPLEEQAIALSQLPLSPEEATGLRALWPKDYLYRIWDIVVLHENIQIQSDLKSHRTTATDRWAERIRRAALDLFRLDRNPCLQRGDTATHIISSNTTSVRNLLSPYIRIHQSTIREWGQQTHPEIMDNAALSESDKLCALCNAYMKKHAAARAEQDEFDKACFHTMRHTEMTGIQVELIDLNALERIYQEHGIQPDPYLADCFQKDASSPPKPRLLVNIDYAFGKQAEELISALSLLFGESLASVGVMGKAGGLQGRRGDIIVADYLIHQEDDQQTIIDNTGVNREALHTLSKRKVWSGGVLTVLGTLLQDSRLLNFYKKLYGCVSLEMEGSFYARELRRYQKAGLLRDDINLRFLYYVSDTPLSQDQTETLSKDLDLSEVIPPQYAVTRALLKPALCH